MVPPPRPPSPSEVPVVGLDGLLFVVFTNSSPKEDRLPTINGHPRSFRVVWTVVGVIGGGVLLTPVGVIGNPCRLRFLWKQDKSRLGMHTL